MTENLARHTPSSAQRLQAISTARSVTSSLTHKRRSPAAHLL